MPDRTLKFKDVVKGADGKPAPAKSIFDLVAEDMGELDAQQPPKPVQAPEPVAKAILPPDQQKALDTELEWILKNG